jgi:hypothetical protein
MVENGSISASEALVPPLACAMLTTLLACTCEASEDGDGPYVRWVAAAMHLCVYADNARDVAALVALAVHVVAWSEQRTQRR